MRGMYHSVTRSYLRFFYSIECSEDELFDISIMTKRSFFSLTYSSVFKRNSNQKVSETDGFSDIRKFHQKIDLTESNPTIMFICFLIQVGEIPFV